MNRQNPYIIQIGENLDPLRLKSIVCIRDFLYRFFYGLLITIIGSIISYKISIYIPIGIILLFLFLGFDGFRNVRKILKSSPLMEITDILYGNQYEKIYVNNERLLNMIENMAGYDALLSFFSNYIKSQFRMFMIMIILIIIPCITMHIYNFVK